MRVEEEEGTRHERAHVREIAASDPSPPAPVSGKSVCSRSVEVCMG